MKKKLVSILLSGALLASSLLATFTVVAAGNTAPVGETAVPAVTAAPAEETAAPAEAAPAEVAAPAEAAAPEAAPAEVAAPAAAAAPEVATVAADVPAATALAADNTVTVDGKKYQITVVQDFDGDTTGVAAAGNGTVSIVDNAIGGTKSASYDGSAVTGSTGSDKFSNLLFKTSATALQGDGLYVEVYTDDANGVGGNKNQQINLLGGNNHTTPLGRYGYSRGSVDSGFTVKGGESVTLEKPHVIMIPWSDFNNTNSNLWDSSMDVAAKNQSLSATNLLYVQITWNQTGGSSIKLDSGSKLYFDNIGFYSDYVEPGVDAVSTYTTWQNPLSTDGDAVNIQTEDGSGATSLLYDMTFEDHSVKYTMTQKSTHAYQSRMYPKVSGAQLAASDRFELTVTVSNKGMMSNPGAFIMRFVNAASSAGTAIMRQITTTARYYTNEGNTYKISIPVADIASSTEASYSGDLASTQYLNLSFVLNTANANIGDSITLSDLKLLKEDAVTFDPGTKVVNVKPTVSDNSALDVSVTNNGDHDITWSDAKDVSLQVKEGASVTLTAKPAEGMQAVWTGIPDQEEVRNASVTFTANADVTPSLTFEKVEGITIHANAEGGEATIRIEADGKSGNGQLSGIAEKADVTLTAPADSGSKKFSCWKHGDNIISYENTLKVKAFTTTAYTAVYEDAGSPVTQKSTLNVYSVTNYKSESEKKIVAVFEWYISDGDLETHGNIGDITIKVKATNKSNGKSMNFKDYDIEYRFGYYVLTAHYSDEALPANLEFEVSVDGATADKVTATVTNSVD